MGGAVDHLLVSLLFLARRSVAEAVSSIPPGFVELCNDVLKVDIVFDRYDVKA